MSRPQPGRVLPFGTRTTICPACRIHQHGSCWAHLAAVGLHQAEFEDCPCGCHPILAERELTRAALEDMARHGTLVDYVMRQRAADHMFICTRPQPEESGHG